MNILVPVIIGAVIYYLVSPDVMFVKMADKLLFGGIHITTEAEYLPFIRIIRNFLPDMMWAYALTFTVFLVFCSERKGLLKSFIVSFVFSTIMETAQLLPFVAGTFDVMDIILETLALAVAVMVIYIKYFTGGKCYEKKK